MNFAKSNGALTSVILNDEGAIPVVGKNQDTSQALLTSAAAPVTGAFVKPGGVGFSVIASGITSSGAGAASIVIEGSHDGVTPITLATIALVLGATVIAEGFGSYVPYRYVRARLVSISGTGAAISATVGA